MRAVGMIGAVGIVAAVVGKLLWMLMFPVLGMILGFFLLVLKIVVIVALVWFGFSLFRRWTDRPSEA